MPNLARSILAVLIGLLLAYAAEFRLPELLMSGGYLSRDFVIGLAELAGIVCLAIAAGGFVVAAVSPHHAVWHYGVVWLIQCAVVVVTGVRFKGSMSDPVLVLGLAGLSGAFGAHMGTIVFGKE